MRRRVTVMNEEYRCTPRSFRCMPLHSEHTGDTNRSISAFWLSLSSTPARRSGHTILHVQLLLAQSAERELGMAWLWPERLDIEVPTAV